MVDHVKDGGVRSRKMIMAYVVMAAGSLAWIATARWPALAATLAELYMFLLGAAGMFMGANAAVKWMGAKTIIQPQQTTVEGGQMAIEPEQQPVEQVQPAPAPAPAPKK